MTIELDTNGVVLFNEKPIYIGDHKGILYSTIGRPKKQFKKTPQSDTLTDDYGYMHVFYDKSDRIYAYEFFPESQLLVSDTGASYFPIFNFSADKLTGLIQDTTSYAQNDGMVFPKLSMNVYVPRGTNSIKSVTVSPADYAPMSRAGFAVKTITTRTQAQIKADRKAIAKERKEAGLPEWVKLMAKAKAAKAKETRTGKISDWQAIVDSSDTTESQKAKYREMIANSKSDETETQQYWIDKYKKGFTIG